MKALEILNRLKKAKTWEEYYPSNNNCNEAIKELEELENRSCSNCNNFQIFNSKVVRDSCCVLNVSDIGGCGDYFEPKKG